MKTNINEVLGSAEDQLENSNALLIIGVTFVILTSLFLSYHSWHIFFRLAGGERVGNSAYFNASTAVGCVEGSLIALIICHFLLFTTPAQKWIGLAGDVVTYVFLLFHTALNFRQNLFGYLDGFAEFYQSNGLPVLVFGATLATWAGIILLDVRAKMRIKTLSALSKMREQELKGALQSKRTGTATMAPVAGFARGRNDERGESPKDLSDLN
jgi:hypothetical protein